MYNTPPRKYFSTYCNVFLLTLWQKIKKCVGGEVVFRTAFSWRCQHSASPSYAFFANGQETLKPYMGRESETCATNNARCQWGPAFVSKGPSKQYETWLDAMKEDLMSSEREIRFQRRDKGFIFYSFFLLLLCFLNIRQRLHFVQRSSLRTTLVIFCLDFAL